MSGSIFATYKTGENLVTASIMAVLRSLSLGSIDRILGALLEQSEFELVRFQNQPSKGGEGVPDAEIMSNFRLIIETKIKRGGVDVEQLKRHLGRLGPESGNQGDRLLLVLTPETSCPRVLDEFPDPRVLWRSFSHLDAAIEDLLGDTREVISEREAFLLRQLQGMLTDEGLTESADDVLVVPARVAWQVYQKHYVYVCQPRRPFKPVKYMAFYSDGKIQPDVPKILEKHDEVVHQRGSHGGKYEKSLGALIDRLLDAGITREGEINKVLVLSAPGDLRTEHLAEPIVNDHMSSSGRPVAFTQNQRYVSLKALKSAKRTSDLTKVMVR